MSSKSLWSFLETSKSYPLEVEIGEEKVTLHFHPLRVKKLAGLKVLIGNLAAYSTELFSGGKDGSISTIQDVDPENNHVITQTQRTGPTVELAKFRSTQKKEAFDKLASSLLHESNITVLIDTIEDSLREKWTESERERFQENLTIGNLIPLLKGVWMACAESVGPLGSWARDLKATFTEKVESLVKQEMEKDDLDDSEEEKIVSKPHLMTNH